jgi:hypothetical protein
MITGCVYIGLTQKAALLLFECFAKQNVPQTRQKSYEHICLKSKCTNIIKKLKKVICTVFDWFLSKTVQIISLKSGSMPVISRKFTF